MSNLKIERVEVFGVAMPLVMEFKNAYLSKSVVKSAVVRITGLRPAAERSPGLEFLQYLTPSGGRPAPIALHANDLFPGYELLAASTATFRVLRNWDLEIDEEDIFGRVGI